MTSAKAATVVSALVTAGYGFTARLVAPDNWTIRAHSNALDVPVGVVATFVTNQGITGLISEVEYS